VADQRVRMPGRSSGTGFGFQLKDRNSVPEFRIQDNLISATVALPARLREDGVTFSD
jgi:hypothetical protein